MDFVLDCWRRPEQPIDPGYAFRLRIIHSRPVNSAILLGLFARGKKKDN